MSWMTKLFGDPNAREVAKLRAIVDRISGMEPAVSALSDEALKAKTAEFRERLAKGGALDDVLEEAFAVTREASKRVLKQRQYDVQLIGGLALHTGTIAEMRTGEGKTLTATAPVYLNALTGKGVHVITVNDYLARRDAIWMGQVYHSLGLSVGCIQHAGSFIYDPDFKGEPQHDEARDTVGAFKVDMDYLRPVSRRAAYAADITYGTNNEFGFDYLRDNMVTRPEEMVQRELSYAVVDEVDSILIDEARTPLIISAPAAEATDAYYKYADVVKQLSKDEDYKVDEKQRVATLTEAGIAKLEKALGIENLYIQGGVKAVHHIEQALRAQALFNKDREYVVRDGEVIIVDEFTGRLMQGRRYSEGLHQAIEAKERVEIQRESVTLATVTFQNYFRLYGKLAGMTGTAATEAEEFHKIYKLEVLSIPTHRENRRADLPDRVYQNQIGKFKAVVREIKERHEKGQPVLVGTVSIEKNELLSELLRQAGVPHEVLNAKNHEREAEIIAQAGRRGAVTVATNMAGRGVDIILGGNPPSVEEAEFVRSVGGLHVLGTERHESRRIDNQLRGRSGRQGDPGTTQFYLSMEDDLMRIFGKSTQRVKNLMASLKVPEDEPIENKMLTSQLAAAQKKVEGHNFDIRKHLLEYDDVLNKHRTVIYKKRREILRAAMEATKEGKSPLQPIVVEMIESEIEQLVSFHTSAEDEGAWDYEKIEDGARAILPAGMDIKGAIEKAQGVASSKEDAIALRTNIIEALMELVQKAYAELDKTLGDAALQMEIEKVVTLRALDDLWISHLEAIDYLRHGVGLQGYGQRDPLVEYKREAYRLFQQLLTTLNQRVSHMIFKVQISKQDAEQELRRMQPLAQPVQLSAPAKTSDELSGAPKTAAADAKFKDVGRNDPCPCGSGKKFKRCHGANV
ncbi:preprotein translocase subunit SecA [Patescibacteria group bacterium]|jgi:preprotein translocase subunit SecA|nr:preprotein translocase subunit SecA [Patescibacteria group bacterium]